MDGTVGAPSARPRISRNVAVLLGIPLDDPDVEREVRAKPDDIEDVRERLERARAELRDGWGWKHGAHAWPHRNPWLLSWDSVWFLPS